MLPCPDDNNAEHARAAGGTADANVAAAIPPAPQCGVTVQIAPRSAPDTSEAYLASAPLV